MKRKKERPSSALRALALQIALHGRETVDATDAEISRAEQYLADLASVDGRLELGKTLLIISDVVERANCEGNDKTVLDAVARYAELVKLADFSETENAMKTAQNERELVAVQYLESTGVIPKGLELQEAARLIAQYVVDELLTRQTTDATQIERN